jgi:hypothetical protein
MKMILAAVAAASLIAFQSAGAQRAEPLGFNTHAAMATTPLHTSTTAALAGNSGMPRWVRWGLVGAVGGAVLFVIADSNHSVGSRILSGAATGFVVVGGGVLLYDAICGGSGPSAFCGR